jgi:tight adherence protein B
VPLSVIGIIVYVVVLIIAWFFRDTLFGSLSASIPVLLGITAGIIFYIASLPLIESLRGGELRRAWRQRLEERDGLARPMTWWQSPSSLIQRIISTLNNGFQKGIGRTLLGWWQDAGFGSQPLSLLIALIGIMSSGSLVGYLLTGSTLLSGFIIFLLLMGFLTLTYSRARMQRQLFQDQFPGVLDRLADSLQAGFSLPQAIEFVIPNLSQPSSSEMAQISGQIRVGFTVDQALGELYHRRPNEDVRLLVEGLTLQRQVGGNMAAMMHEMADMVRKRVELENEVRTMTAQGRLSAVVIALLVPVSLGLLSMFPGYTDVLFNTTVGNLVLIAAGILEMIGAAIVIRLIRIEV